MRITKRLIAGSLICIMLVLNFYNANPVHALTPTDTYEEATGDNPAATISLNCIFKNLKLGYDGADTYDFDVEGTEGLAGASYSWYVKADKGDPDAVSINKKTGLVTAKKAGTAYIRCKITLEDGTILRPEAGVEVYNNITGIDIGNLPEAMTITAGSQTEFKGIITDTKAGKGEDTNGIIAWEISDDSSNAAILSKDTNDGIVFPTSEGEFKIRAICFQSNHYYKRWERNKAKYGDYITAASQWHTIIVAPSDGTALVSTQTQLDKALASDSFETITLSTDKTETFVIEQGDYSSKSLIVDAPNADIKNYGVFKDIIIKAIKDSTWIEYANGNIIYLEDSQLSLVIDSDADIKQIVIDTPGTEINLDIKGSVGNIRILQPSKVNITGTRGDIPITVEETATGSNISTSVSLNMTLNADTGIILNRGSEGSKIDKSKSSIELKIDNKSNSYIPITTNQTGREIIYAQSSGISNDTTIPSPGSYEPSDMQATSLRLTPSNMVLSISGSALSMFVAITTPEYTTDTISWSSSDTDIATIDQDGVVTPVGLGTAHILARTANTSAIAEVSVVSGPAIHIESVNPMLHSAAAFIATSLAQGALERVGSELMGWGLKEAGLNVGSTTEDEIKAMSAKLDQISKQLTALEKQLADAVEEITFEVKKNEVNTRIGQMSILIGNIKSISKSLDFLITTESSSEWKKKKAQEIIKQIELHLISQENQIHNQLVGVGAQTSLIKIYSEAIKASNKFLDTGDTEKVYEMYEYFANIQINMLILMVEYYHAVYDDPNDAKLEIDRLIEIFLENIEEQEALLKPKMPEGYIFDKDNKIMIYTGHFGIRIKTRFITINPIKGPIRTNIFNRMNLKSNMTYNYGYTDWRLLARNELELWFNKSQGGLYNYLVSAGWDNPNMNKSYELGMDMGGPFGYVGLNVGSGKVTTTVIPRLFSSGYFVDSPQGDNIDNILLYWILCRPYTNELNMYFY